jgi:hypothetical protein
MELPKRLQDLAREDILSWSIVPFEIYFIAPLATNEQLSLFGIQRPNSNSLTGG